MEEKIQVTHCERIFTTSFPGKINYESEQGIFIFAPVLKDFQKNYGINSFDYFEIGFHFQEKIRRRICFLCPNQKI